MTFLALAFILFGLLLMLSSIENQSLIATFLKWTGRGA